MRYLFLFCCIMLMACQEEALQHEADIQMIKEYLSTNSIVAEEDSEANYFYVLTSNHTDSIGPVRDAGLTVEVKYKAYLLDGTTVVDNSLTSVKVKLDKAIYGWQLALPRMLIKDKMQLFLPSRLAYGKEGRANVPANSVLVFDIELINVFPHF